MAENRPQIDENGNGWREWSNHVLLELERLDKAQQDSNKELVNIRVQLANLQGRAAVWGGLVGAVAAGVIGLLFRLLGG